MEEEWGVTANAPGVSFQSEDNALNLLCDKVTQPCEYTKSHWI